MIENEGFPDQTYDVWIADGVSAYTGGLWVAALFGMERLAGIMKDGAGEIKYGEMARKAKVIYNESLWNGSYYDYSEKGKKNSTSIMADQMCGQWWSRVCKLENVVDDAMKARSSLKKVRRGLGILG